MLGKWTKQHHILWEKHWILKEKQDQQGSTLCLHSWAKERQFLFCFFFSIGIFIGGLGTSAPGYRSGQEGHGAVPYASALVWGWGDGRGWGCCPAMCSRAGLSSNPCNIHDHGLALSHLLASSLFTDGMSEDSADMTCRPVLVLCYNNIT
jgi:hypothetical protein